jgi:predicted ATPase/DNA-binding SARP family transcriptional activator/predicted negative regulator of RcsB-dependent stress response
MPDMEPPWQIDLFGEVRAVRGERVIARFRTRKTAALLAYLAYHCDRGHPREALIDLLWPGASVDAGRNGLCRELSSLRSQLEPPGFEAGSVVLADRLTVQLRPAAVATDVRRFEQAVRAAGAASGGERLRLLASAVELYRGDLLPSIYLDWVPHERERLRATFLAAARELATGLGREDRPRAIEVLKRALGVDPLSEETRRDLMRQLAAAGDPRAALRTYEELERALRRELDAPPSPATREVAREIEASVRGVPPGRDVARTAPPPAQPSTQPLAGTLTFLAVEAGARGAPGERLVREYGGHDLGDAPPERRVVAFARATDALACALAALGDGPARLALDTGEVDLSRRDSRGALLERARRLEASAAAGQILVSEETAVLVRHDLDAGVRLADLGVFRLEGVPAPRRLFQALPDGRAKPSVPRNARRISEGSLPLELSRFFGRAGEVEALRGLLEPGGTRLLTVTGPGGVGKTRLALQVVRALTEPYLGSVAFVPLADLSEPGQIASALAASLGVEPPPGTDALQAIARALPGPALVVLDNFEHLVASGAAVVRTLLERAPGVTCLVTSRQRLGLQGEREFPLGPLPVPGLDEPLESLGGLASVQLFLDRAQAVRSDASLASLDARAVSELVRRLEGFPLALSLAAGRTQVLSPAEILARFAERLDLLVARERDVPARHRTLRAAIDSSYTLLAPRLQRVFARLAVFRGGFSVEAATALAEGDPLVLDDLAELCECSLVERDAEASRYRVLETLREFALEQLSSEERERVERQHAEHFLAFAERGTRLLPGPDGGPWLERFRLDYENLRAAIAWARSRREDELGVRIALALGPFWQLRGPVGEGREVLGQLLEGFTATTPLRGQALLLLAGLANKLCDLEAARRHVTEGLALFRTLSDRGGIATALVNLGIVAANQGDEALARSVTEESLGILRELGKPLPVAMALGNLAGFAVRAGENAAALAHWEEALALGRSIGNRRIEVLALQDLSRTSLATGSLARARATAEEALAVSVATGADALVGLSHLALGMVTAYEGDLASARSRLGESRTIFEGMSDLGNLFAVRLALVQLAVLEGDAVTGQRELDAALALVRSKDDPEGTTGVARFRGDLARLANERAAAREHYRAKLASHRSAPDVGELAPCLEGLAWVERCEGQLFRAARLLGAAASLRERFGTPPWPRERRVLEEERVALGKALAGSGFEAAWAAGHALSVEGAIACALDS